MGEKKNIRICIYIYIYIPGSSAAPESDCNAGDMGLIPGSGNPLEKGWATHSSILGLPL